MKATSRFDLGNVRILRRSQIDSRTKDDDEREGTFSLPFQADIPIEWLDSFAGESMCGREPFKAFLYDDEGKLRPGLPVSKIPLDLKLEQSVKLSRFSVGSNVQPLITQATITSMHINPRDGYQIRLTGVIHGDLPSERANVIVEAQIRKNVDLELMAPPQGDLLADEQQKGRDAAQAAAAAAAAAAAGAGASSFPDAIDGTGKGAAGAEQPPNEGPGKGGRRRGARAGNKGASSGKGKGDAAGGEAGASSSA